MADIFAAVCAMPFLSHSNVIDHAEATDDCCVLSEIKMKQEVSCNLSGCVVAVAHRNSTRLQGLLEHLVAAAARYSIRAAVAVALRAWVMYACLHMAWPNIASHVGRSVESSATSKFSFD